MAVVLNPLNVFARYQAGSIGVVTKFLGATVFSPQSAANPGFPLSMTVLEFYTQERKGATLYTPYVQIRFATPMLADNQKGTFIEQFRWGFLFGGSQTVFSKIEKNSGTGWSLQLNGGFTMDFLSAADYSHMSPDVINTPVNFGAELSLRAVYNFHRYVAFTFGFDIAYMMSVSFFADNAFDSSHYETVGQIVNNVIPFYQALTYGLSMGFLF
ncbi:MAG: hypothetical protein ACRCTQ_01855 [Brevinemataceae bacterium]